MQARLLYTPSCCHLPRCYLYAMARHAPLHAATTSPTAKATTRVAIDASGRGVMLGCCAIVGAGHAYNDVTVTHIHANHAPVAPNPIHGQVAQPRSTKQIRILKLKDCKRKREHIRIRH
jgi:hypothetical protein